MSEEGKRALSVYLTASKAIMSAKPNDKGAEDQYASAYKVLVQLGLRSPLREKYR